MKDVSSAAPKVKRKGFNDVVYLTLILFVFTSMIIIINEGRVMAAGGADGKKVYESRCVICHGPKGDGKGLMDVVHRNEKKGMVWKVYPRDFTAGIFKFRSTLTGCLPTDGDLLKTLNSGIMRSGMPSFKDIPESERLVVIQYIKDFSPRWKKEKTCESLKPVPPSWLGSASSVQKGQEVWKSMQCSQCHGEEGKGDGPKAVTLKDDWGDQSFPFDFTTGATKLGPDPRNVYLAFTTGLDGSGMPSYASFLSEEDRWNLVSYALKLMGRIK